ncbi:MAG: ROK family transcriptional regulator [Chloroflexi bacterium]|nr:MAG: ROK family transcriptional regulator [Chloroflexota bacterium]
MTSQKTADHAYVRKLNTATILNLLRTTAPVSRAELAKQTGLNRSTVSSIVNQLLQNDLVRETELQREGVGRPGMSLTLNPDGGAAIGVELGVDFISVVVSDLLAQVRWRVYVDVDASLGQAVIVNRAEAIIDEVLAETAVSNLPIFGIGVGVPGLVDVQSGVIKLAPNLQWQDVPIKSMWQERFQLPVHVENEANAAALGEHYFGVAKETNDFIYLSAGVGLGGGIMLQGQLFRGSGGYAGEIGHMTIDVDGALCSCGRRGCWETVVGPRAVERLIRTQIREGADSLLTDMAQGNVETITFDQIVEAAHQGDAVAESALQKVAVSLGIGIANLVNVFNPEMIVLGGRLRLAGELITPTIAQTVQQNSLQHPLDNVKFANSAHGAEACVMGAIALVMDNVLREPTIERS